MNFPAWYSKTYCSQKRYLFISVNSGAKSLALHVFLQLCLKNACFVRDVKLSFGLLHPPKSINLSKEKWNCITPQKIDTPSLKWLMTQYAGMVLQFISHIETLFQSVDAVCKSCVRGSPPRKRLEMHCYLKLWLIFEFFRSSCCNCTLINYVRVWIGA